MQGMKENIKPIFLCGHRKSGTTMLMNLFDSHPGLYVYPSDIRLFYAYYPLYEEKEYSFNERKNRINRIIFQLFEEHKIISKYLDIGSFRKKFFERIESEDFHTENIFNSLILAFQEISKPVLKQHKGTVIKETSLEIYAKLLFRWHTNAKFIHLIRDPRDNFAALKAGLQKRYREFGDDEKTILHSLIERCKLGMMLADINQDIIGKNQYCIIRFEDLVTAPEKQLRYMCQFLGINFDESLLVPTIMGNPTRGNSFDDLDFSTISDQNVGKYFERISEYERQIIEFHFHDVMKRFNYTMDYNESDQAEAACQFYKWSNYKYHYYDRYKDY